MQHAHTPPAAYVVVQPRFALLAQIVKIPPSRGYVPYHQLECTELDKSLVFEIISTVAQSSKITLYIKENHLNELGAKIEHLHPLKFLSTIFLNDYLRGCMPDIFEDYFKRSGFMKGLAPRLNVEADKGKLDQYISSFAKELDVSADGLRPYIAARDWENLVRYLIVHLIGS
ncbi:MAG: hypothetical protein KGJ02_05920 [Verrucomicrobiota bacterium]|nr:hypothetical protein [Verrucomicrobiota bacterium]